MGVAIMIRVVKQNYKVAVFPQLGIATVFNGKKKG